MTSDRNEQLRANLLKKLKGLEMVLGCSAEDLLSVLALEIGARLPQQENVNLDDLALKVVKLIPPVDINSISQKISIAIETKMAGKLDEVMSLMQKGLSEAKPNPEGIIQGVAAILQPGIAQAAQQAAEAVFTANAEALKKNIATALDTRLKELSAAGTASQVVAPGNSGVPGMSGGLMQMAMSNPEGLKSLAEALKGIIDIFRPSQPAANANVVEFNRLMSFHDLMTKIEKRVATPDEISRGVSQVFTGVQAAPAAAAPSGGQAAPAK